MIEITERPIDVQKIIDAASNKQAGAVNVFVGTIRDLANGKAVTRFEYEAYEPMAVSEIGKIIDEASRRWPVLAYAVSHRTGVLAPGDVAVVIAIATPHRKESFAACQFVIDELKLKAPIWKKEIFEGGEEWISAHP